MKIIVISFIALFLLTSCLPNKKTTADFQELAQRMEGHFASSKQALNNSKHEKISMQIFPILKDKGTYFIVEQALFDSQEKPFSIQIYKLYQKRYDIVKEVYVLKNEKEWIEKRRTSQNYSDLSIADLELVPGCQITINKRADGSYSGHTGHDCHLTEFKAPNSSVGINIAENQIRLWEQGYDKDWNLLWGNTNNGTVFERVRRLEK